MQKLVIYNHGKDSIPWGEKAIALADVAKRHGFACISPDYQASHDPDLRVRQLLAMDLSAYRDIVLVGSSMGAYVATVASELIKPRGLFLIAPAVYLPGYQCTEFKPTAEAIRVFHGWHDDVVPPENAWKFCQKYRIRLDLYDTDHRMLSVMPQLSDEFGRFLAGL
ncbi:MAG: YqiA/YcfP family alpha/beta fold hydrolase [Methylobacter sp.]|nr:YqiA/YcfP family alpha/beta fold hydrolase [Methylobacter sp.]MDP2429871.1 YqiA/YcfP family alpha/beta fold hydrolase [Methylobacter sp.]MDP3053311.1 YqiA/YcfP family alpha/beta fold hydrolase [Methylobacter sp.]MDP3361057.1 YqiA/YcfP family alpha/beta fold hydrolase [Methylobacter sp.]MDZ4218394.1 YqiA/YcfP family alpha/beta fold hydrolase [Methylobacter sp.]